MNKIMKKYFAVAVLSLGVMVASSKPAMALDYETSTWTARILAIVSTQTTAIQSPTFLGVIPTPGFDVTRVLLSTGYSNGAYFVCADTLPATSAVMTLGLISPEQYLFPPVTFVPSSATVTGTGVQTLDLRDAQGGGRTIRAGLVCYVAGDATNRYWWSLETSETPSATERR